MLSPTYRPGDNLFTNSAISWDPDSGKMNWYFQFTPGDMWDYDEVGTHIMIDGNVGGQQRKLLTHSARNGFIYTMERANGAMVQRQSRTWTTSTGPRGSTRRPANRSTTTPTRTFRPIRRGQPNPREPTKKVCPSIAGGNNYWPVLLQSADQVDLYPGHDGHSERYRRHAQAQQGERAGTAAPTRPPTATRAT